MFVQTLLLNILSSIQSCHSNWLQWRPPTRQPIDSGGERRQQIPASKLSAQQTKTRGEQWNEGRLSYSLVWHLLMLFIIIIIFLSLSSFSVLARQLPGFPDCFAIPRLRVPVKINTWSIFVPLSFTPRPSQTHQRPHGPHIARPEENKSETTNNHRCLQGLKTIFVFPLLITSHRDKLSDSKVKFIEVRL